MIRCCNVALGLKLPKHTDQRMTSHQFSAADIVEFWTDAGPARWFKKDADFDDRFRSRFAAAHQVAADGGLGDWQANANGALALLILLDQYPRNSFRGSARMYVTDPQALAVAQSAVAAGFDAAVDRSLRLFFYLPFIHSEQLAQQDRALELYAALGEETQRHAHVHRDIILRFGRFPHRNALLGRATSVDEQAFLDAGGFAG